MTYYEPTGLRSDRFCRAMKRHYPVWRMENLRVQIHFEWEPEFEDQFYSPSSALSYAVLHNHISYARYLLIRFAEDSLKVPELKHDQYPRYAFHLGISVSHNRPEILKMIIETTQQVPRLQSYINLEKSYYLADGKTSLHLACKNFRPGLVLILLSYGAQSRPDNMGRTPMDEILTQLRSRDFLNLKMQCLDHLLVFTPPESLQMRTDLRKNCEYWETLLGEDIYAYMLRERPAPLSLMSMKKVLQQLPPSNLISSIESLPIPRSLKDRFTNGQGRNYHRIRKDCTLYLRSLSGHNCTQPSATRRSRSQVSDFQENLGSDFWFLDPDHHIPRILDLCYSTYKCKGQGKK
ncbi:ankyrin repeat domain-containing protein 9-like [Dendrobates tinctorius]|uniref:ankyrin repeat domain-containing protein 9-like n=1 Tax=Dendrobates tinctorius TaxID=92724 RepID=UPI003CC9DB59